MSEEGAVESTSDADVVAEMTAPAWSYAEGVGGEGDAPEWFKSDKYKSVSDQAKAYTELEGRFGAFTGAPESYEFSLSEQLTEAGVELASDDPLIAQFTEMAKEANMSQDMANKLVNMFVESEYAKSGASEEAETARIAEEMAKLGDNAQQRVSNIENWAKANLTPEQVEGLTEMATTAASVTAIEALIAKSKNAPMQTTDVNPVGSGKSLDELNALKFARDENGNLKAQVDPEYRKMVSAEFERAFPGENIITVGG